MSGGIDSCVLLDVCKRVQQARGQNLELAPLALNAKNFPIITAISVTHFDHRAHAKAAEQASFVQELAKKAGLNFYLGRAQTKLTSEAELRQARLKFCWQIAQKIAATHVAFAHQALDNAETFCLNLLRGTGLAGLSGMPELTNFPLGKNSNLKIWRPLIQIPRTQILAYAKARQLKFVTDPTNAEVKFKRNFLRLKIWPLLKKLNLQATKNILQAQKILQASQEFFSQAAQNFFAPYAQSKSLPLAKFQALPKILQTEVLRLITQQALGHLPQVSHKNFQEILALTRNSAGNKKKAFGTLTFLTTKHQGQRVLAWKITSSGSRVNPRAKSCG